MGHWESPVDQLTYLAALLLFFCVAAVITVWVIRAFVRLVRYSCNRALELASSLFGKHPVDRLTGFLLAFPFFADSVGDAVQRIVRFALLATIALPQHFERVWLQSVDACRGSTPMANCLSTLGFGALRFTTAIDDAASRSQLIYVPIGSLFLLVLLASAIGHLTGLVRDSIGSQPVQSPKTVISGAQRNLALTAVMILGGFFVIASVVAIPLLEPSVASESADIEAFKSRTEKAVASDEQFERAYPVDIAAAIQLPSSPAGPFTHAQLAKSSPAPTGKPSVEDRATDVDAGVPAAADAGSPFDAGSGRDAAGGSAVVQGTSTPERDAGVTADRNLNDGAPNAAGDAEIFQSAERETAKWFERIIDDRRREAQTSWSELRSEVRRQQSNVQSALMSEFRISEVNLKTRREKLEYVASLENWAARRLSTLTDALNECRESIKQRESAFAVFRDNFISTGTTWSSLAKLPEIDLRCVAPEEYYLSSAVRGGELGPFGFIARWLVLTDSVALALITGLVGCGLLGSVVSTFVRKRIVTAPQNTIAESDSAFYELLSVIVRGVSAAFVVFLAAKGGLAIIAANGTQPNPYVLLLACILAAVFSERVWTWAEKKLLPDILGDKTLRGDAHVAPEAPASAAIGADTTESGKTAKQGGDEG
ncbi:hypothetical protein [Sorangium sp. So ce388]|uniref:hypothetical protein n=1 Tax=Sorangium sp. So ce388 TaxID=3133309 RepID=UPI003F5B9B69